VSDAALEQVVDLELAERSSVEIACAYRALCAAILLRTAMVAKAKTPPKKQEIDQKRTAVKWVDGGQGVITFEAACEALDMPPERARNAINEYVRGDESGAINTMRCKKPHSRVVTGGRYVARSFPDPVRKDAPVHGVAPRPPVPAPHRGSSPWP